MRKPIELIDPLPRLHPDKRVGKILTPPFVHKLVKQLAEAVKEAGLELFDPSFDQNYQTEIGITIQEARALVEFNTLLNGPMEGFIEYEDEEVEG